MNGGCTSISMLGQHICQYEHVLTSTSIRMDLMNVVVVVVASGMTMPGLSQADGQCAD